MTQRSQLLPQAGSGGGRTRPTTVLQVPDHPVATTPMKNPTGSAKDRVYLADGVPAVPPPELPGKHAVGEAR